MEILILALFCLALFICICLSLSILYALILGLLLFFIYALKKGFQFHEVFEMCLQGIKTAKNILLTFMLIGILTALWRASGTIPAIICYSSSLFIPSLFLTVTFLLNCIMSCLTGTAFGTVATMGVICATMGSAMGISSILTGGAILSGIYFGDRCSPVSTSALLVSELTSTNIFSNIHRMLRTAWIPFIITCLIYTVIGFHLSTGSTDMDFREIFQQEFRISWIALLPAVSIMLLSFLHVNVKLTMLVSILTAIPVSIWLQGTGITDLLYFAGFGYKAKNAGLGAMINGGGIISMIKVAAIVCLSSSYSGIFQKTGLLSSIQEKIQSASSHITAYGAILVTAVLTAMLSCNQTLTIMLTHQLCHDLKKEKENFAIDLENSAVVIPALIPWSVAGAVPLASISAPPVTIIAACFLYLLPIWQLFISLRKGSRF